jgi:hypothetical protein
MSTLRPQPTVTPSPYQTYAVLGFKSPDDTCQSVIWRVIANDEADALAIVKDGDERAAAYVLRAREGAIGGARPDSVRGITYFGPWPWDRP